MTRKEREPSPTNREGRGAGSFNFKNILKIDNTCANYPLGNNKYLPHKKSYSIPNTSGGCERRPAAGEATGKQTGGVGGGETPKPTRNRCEAERGSCRLAEEVGSKPAGNDSEVGN